MKIKRSFLLLGIVLSFSSLSCQIDQYFTFAQPHHKTVSPVSNFDAAAVQKSLQEGNATITGTVLLKARNLSNTHIKQDVYLFPATPYFEEFLALKKKNRQKKVIPSKEFLATKIAARISDEDGSFTFHNVKPGKYFLYTELYLLGSRSGEVWSWKSAMRRL